MANEERHCFITEWYDSHAEFKRQYQLMHYAKERFYSSFWFVVLELPRQRVSDFNHKWLTKSLTGRHDRNVRYKKQAQVFESDAAPPDARETVDWNKTEHSCQTALHC